MHVIAILGGLSVPSPVLVPFLKRSDRVNMILFPPVTERPLLCFRCPDIECLWYDVCGTD